MEALLTGESEPVSKDENVLKPNSKKPNHKPSASVPVEIDLMDGEKKKKKKVVPLGDRINMAFMNTTVTRGEGTGIVVQTSMNTAIGKIASEIESAKDELTPLQVHIYILFTNHLRKE
jgi:magnesium-transporting ATPase (P-type)